MTSDAKLEMRLAVLETRVARLNNILIEHGLIDIEPTISPHDKMRSIGVPAQRIAQVFAGDLTRLRTGT